MQLDKRNERRRVPRGLAVVQCFAHLPDGRSDGEIVRCSGQRLRRYTKSVRDASHFAASACSHPQHSWHSLPGSSPVESIPSNEKRDRREPIPDLHRPFFFVLACQTAAPLHRAPPKIVSLSQQQQQQQYKRRSSWLGFPSTWNEDGEAPKIICGFIPRPFLIQRHLNNVTTGLQST
jgi:hypothetical protein